MIRRAALALCLSLLPFAGGAQSGEPAAMASDAAAQLALAHAALEAAKGANDRVKALTETITAYENGLEALREGLRRAALRQSAIAAEFNAESAQLSQLLGALVAIEADPGPLTLLHPDGPLGTARSGIMMAEVTPALSAEVDDLRVRLEEVALLRALQQNAADTLQEALTGVQAARTELSQAISNRTDLPRRLLADPAQLQALINSAETLEGFASGLADLPEEEALAPLPDLTAARGALPLPVEGTLLRAAGEADAAGIRRPGILIATRPQALVTAPWAATIRYAGPLLDYGNVIILEPGSEILMVIAGLDRVYGHLGEVLPAGTPIGLMGGTSPSAGEILGAEGQAGGATQSETLYIEIRQGEETVDPALWFALE